MSTQRNIAINFQTSAELAGAKQMEQAIDRVGTATDKSAGKLDAYDLAVQRLKQTLDKAKDGLRDSGEEAGKATAEGMGGGLELAANMHLAEQAISLGSMIGSALGKAMTMAWEGTLQGAIDEVLAPWSDAAARRMAESLQADVAQGMREVYAQIKRDQEKFWQEYMNSAPPNAGDWLDEIKNKAEAASKALQFVALLQSAEGDDRVAKIEADAEDKKTRISEGPGTEAEKKREALRVDQEKEIALFEERSRKRAEEVQRQQAEAELKAKEVERLRQAELQQQQRVGVEQRANARAEAEIQSRELGGSKLPESEKQSYRDKAFAEESKRAGIQVIPGQNEGAELTQIRDQRLAAEKAAREAADAAEMKRREQALREATDADKTSRGIEKKEREISAVQEAPKEEVRATAPVTPGQEQAPAPDLVSQLGTAAQTTGNSGLKLALEELKRSLADGASAQELKQAAELMQRASLEGNSSMSAVVAAVRGSIETTAQQLAALAGRWSL